VPLGHEQRAPPPPGFRLDRQFFLGELRPARAEPPSGLEVEELPLAAAAESPALRRLLEEGFPRHASFLHALLPFLATLDAEFRTVFLRRNGDTLGAVSVGVAGGAAIVLNAVVAKAARGQGLSRALAALGENAAADLGAREAFFWTEHAFLGAHAARFCHYRVFVKASA
jgi:hypothetical protein